MLYLITSCNFSVFLLVLDIYILLVKLVDVNYTCPDLLTSAVLCLFDGRLKYGPWKVPEFAVRYRTKTLVTCSGSVKFGDGAYFTCTLIFYSSQPKNLYLSHCWLVFKRVCSVDWVTWRASGLCKTCANYVRRFCIGTNRGMLPVH